LAKKRLTSFCTAQHAAKAPLQSLVCCVRLVPSHDCRVFACCLQWCEFPWFRATLATPICAGERAILCVRLRRAGDCLFGRSACLARQDGAWGGRLWTTAEPLRPFSLFTYLTPARALVGDPVAWTDALTLQTVAVVSLAATHFLMWRRDLSAPLWSMRVPGRTRPKFLRWLLRHLLAPPSGSRHLGKVAGAPWRASRQRALARASWRYILVVSVPAGQRVRS